MENNKDAGNMGAATFRLEGLGCACEAKVVEKRVKALKGIKSFDMNPISNLVKVAYDPTLTSVDDIKNAMCKGEIKATIINRKK